MKKISLISSLVLLGGWSHFLEGSDAQVELAWLGFLHLPEKKIDSKAKVQPSSPLIWKSWSLEEGPKGLDWVPRDGARAEFIGKTLNVLPPAKGQKEDATRRKRHLEY